MATVPIDLPISAALIPSTNGAGVEPVKNTAADPAPELYRGVFADAATKRLMWSDRLPTGLGTTISQIDIKIGVESSVASNNQVWEARIACITPGAGETISGSKSFGTAVTLTLAMAGTIGQEVEGTITLDSSAELDNAAPGDTFVVVISRLGSDGSDSNTGIGRLNHAQMILTTS